MRTEAVAVFWSQIEASAGNNEAVLVRQFNLAALNFRQAHTYYAKKWSRTRQNEHFIYGVAIPWSALFKPKLLLRCSKIQLLARNRKVNKCIHNIMPLNPILNQMNSIHNLRHHLLRTNLILLFYLVPGLLNGVFFHISLQKQFIDFMSPEIC